MNDETRIDQYLSARAVGVELPPASVSGVLDRVARRRRSRRAVFSACSAVAVLGGALSVVNLGGSDAPEHVVARPGGGTLVASTLQWAAVTPRTGLGWASSSVIGPGNALYALSTAPGSTGDDSGGPATLYRSADGVEWKTDTAPDGLSPVSLAANGEQLYAVGTGAAGGGTALRLASRTGTGAWTTIDLPSDLAAVEARYGVRFAISGFSVASQGTRVVVAANVQVSSLDSLLPAGAASGGYALSATGVDVYAAPEADPDGAPGTPNAAAEVRKREPVVVASYTWAQLGIDAALRSLILGETRVFVSDAGAAFTAVTPPAGLHSTQSLVATTDGMRLIGTTGAGRASLAVWTSPDGRDWTTPAVRETDSAWLTAAGTPQGRLAFVAAEESTDGGSSSVAHVEQPDGSFLELDLVDAARRAGAQGTLYASTADVGPLGVAALVVQVAPDRSERIEHVYLVVTTDGFEFSVTDLAEHGLAGSTGYPSDVRVTADAITVSWHSGREPQQSQLLVGTPGR